ncbi:hypothetical protein EDD17DRAFT_1592107 [Pisolithus thermaeus]|nr:hypothetical protein EDD17DRAFT_1592107 [Pisolithus thermaeus]
MRGAPLRLRQVLLELTRLPFQLTLVSTQTTLHSLRYRIVAHHLSPRHLFRRQGPLGLQVRETGTRVSTMRFRGTKRAAP